MMVNVMIAYYQGRALGEPDGPWRLTFALTVATFFVTEAEGPKPEGATPETGTPSQ